MANSTSRVFSDSQLADIIRLKNADAAYADIAAYLAKHYGLEVSTYSVQRAYLKYQHLFDVNDKKTGLKLLKDVARTKRNNSLTAKQNRVILDALNEQQDVLEQVREAVRGLGKMKIARPAKPASKSATKTDVTVEVLVSDVHIGKKTPEFNLEVCRQRLRLYTQVVVQEIARKKAHYNVERIVLALLGDIIENATMHGVESARGCEFGNAEQVRFAIELLMAEVVVPLAQLGIPMDVVCVGGNHDRDGEDKTYHHPSQNALSWIIYQTLKMLCEQAKLKHVTWRIADGVYVVLDIYGDAILYEHGDHVKGFDRKSFMNQLAKRSGQVGKLLKGIRIGHVHVHSTHDNGAAVVNGSVCGQDSYADVLGFNSLPLQVVTYYVRTANRDNAYYYSLPVQLGGAT